MGLIHSEALDWIAASEVRRRGRLSADATAGKPPAAGNLVSKVVGPSFHICTRLVSGWKELAERAAVGLLWVAVEESAISQDLLAIGLEWAELSSCGSHGCSRGRKWREKHGKEGWTPSAWAEI
jgi:hypothetical protein